MLTYVHGTIYVTSTNILQSYGVRRHWLSFKDFPAHFEKCVASFKNIHERSGEKGSQN